MHFSLQILKISMTMTICHDAEALQLKDQIDFCVVPYIYQIFGKSENETL